VALVALATGCRRTEKAATLSVPVPGDVALPMSTAGGAPNPDALRVVLSRQRLAIGPDERLIANVPNDPEHGLLGETCASKSACLLIPALLSSVSSPPGDSSPLGDASPPEALLVADGSMPYRAVIEVLYTLAKTHVCTVGILVRAGSKQGVIRVAAPTSSCYPPKPIEEPLLWQMNVPRSNLIVTAIVSPSSGVIFSSPPPGKDAGAGTPVMAVVKPPTTPAPSADSTRDASTHCFPRLDLTVTLEARGFWVTLGGMLDGGGIAAGCHERASDARLTVPKLGGAYDLPGLAACAASLKHDPDLDWDTTPHVTFSAFPEVPLQAIVSAIDALRSDTDGGELYPDVTLW
jgi:hypothetical protein